MPARRRTSSDRTRRRGRANRRQPYGWLGAGALTLGVGAVLAGAGSGVACAHPTESGQTSTTSTSAGDNGQSQTHLSASNASGGAKSQVKAPKKRHEAARTQSVSAASVPQAPTSSTASPSTTLSIKPVVRRPAAAKGVSVQAANDAVSPTPTGAMSIDSASATAFAPSPAKAVTPTTSKAVATAVAAPATATNTALTLLAMFTPLLSATATGRTSTTAVSVSITTSASSAPIPGTATITSTNTTTGVVTGTLGFTDPQNLALTYTVSTKPTTGTVTVSKTGTFTYTPTTAARRAAGTTTSPVSDTFTVTASNGSAAATEQVKVTVSPILDVPTAGTPSVGTPNATSGVVTGTVKFSDPQKLPLTYGVTSQGSSGTVTITSTGSFTYTPTTAAREAAGTTTKKTTDTFTVTATNGVASAVETVTVTISPILDKPLAGTPTEGAPNTSTGALTGVLGFTDPQHLTLTYTVTTKAGKGTATVNPDGSFTYTPTVAARKAAGTTLTPVTDTFTVTAKNGVASTSESVTVTVSPILDVPQAGIPTAGTANTQTGAVTGKLKFTDPAGKALTYTVSTGPAQGTVTVSSTGTYTYTPTIGARTAAGTTLTPVTDTFTVTAHNAVTATAETVTVTISPIRDVPKAGTPTVSSADANTGAITGTLGFTDPAGLSLGYTLKTAPASGSVTLNASTGAFTYTPTTAARIAAGTTTKTIVDTFTVTATNAVASTQETVTVTVSPILDVPVAGSPTVGAPNSSTGALKGTLGFTDPAGKTLTYTVSTKPNTGTVTVTQTGTFTYTPTVAARKAAAASLTPLTDTFTITARNAVAATTETVTVTVAPSLDKPVAGNPTVGTPNVNTGAVTGTVVFTDAAGRPLTYSASATSTGGGTITVNASTGAYTYTPTTAQRLAAKANTSDTFTVVANNGLASTSETVTVAVDPGTPIASTTTVGTPSSMTGVVTGTVLFTDTAGRTVTCSASTTSAGGGTVTFNSTTGAFTYTPTQTQRQSAVSSTTDTFTVTASNGVRSAIETITVPVQPPAMQSTSNTFVVIGDSINTSPDVYHLSGGNADYLPYVGESYYNQLAVDSSQRMQFGGVWAQDGATLGVTLSKLLPNVLALSQTPGACIVMAGANDVDQGVPISTSVANLESITTQLLAKGIVPILVVVPPDQYTAGKNAATEAWNAWVRQYAAAECLPLLDAYTPVADSAGNWLPGYTSDYINPNMWGSAAIADQALADGLANLFPQNKTVFTSTTSTDATNLFGSGTGLNYGVFTTSSNGLGTGLTQYGSGTASIVTPTESDDLSGNWQQLSRTDGQTGTTTLASGLLTGWHVGDVISFSARVQTTDLNTDWSATDTVPTDINALNCYLRQDIPTGYVTAVGTKTSMYQGLFNWIGGDVDGLFQVEFTILPGTTALQLGFGIGLYSGSAISGNPVARFGEVTVTDVTTGQQLV